VRKWWIVWPLYAALMGFFLGGSVFFGFYGPNVTEGNIAAQQQHHVAVQEPKYKKEETDEAIARYTLWLMAFTGVLALATIGLFIATIFLYATGEKQFGFAVRTAIRQSNSTKEAIGLTRKAFEVEHRTWVKVWPNSAKFGLENGNVFCTIKLRAENVGKSPAQFVSLHLIPYQARGFVAGDQERDALVEQSLRFAEISSRGVVLMPGEPMIGRFGANAETSSHLEAKAEEQIMAGVPEGNLTMVLSVAFCVVYKTQASTDWHYTSGIAVLRAETGSAIPGDYRHIEAGDAKITILPTNGKMT
jgi:hypothetical protein